ncbi:MAG: hypothetical protein ACJA2S_003225 [Cyclobacteriaceae bacterium]|jgi:hypothetical protein
MEHNLYFAMSSVKNIVATKYDRSAYTISTF